MTSLTMRTQDFIASEGVNTHINYNDGAYANLTNIITDLAYLGITHVRDGLNTPGQFGSPSITAYETVAAAGIKFTLVVGGGSFNSTGGTPTDPSLDQRIGYIDQLVQADPGSVVAVEGTNEINNLPIVFNGLGASKQGADELNAAVSLQRALYSGVHADPNLQGVAVDYFTGYAAGTIPVGPDPATTAGLADIDTQHPYPNGGQAPAYWVARSTALTNETPADATALAKAVYTETGYSSNGGTGGAVNLDVQAKYTLDLFLDDAKNGISSTDLYELLDAYAPGSRQGDAGYGLFDDTGAAKPVAVALHNMNALLTDSAAKATTFITSALNYTVSGESSTGNDFAMEKADGSYVVALWDEQSIWNAKLGVETTATSRPVTLSLSGVINPTITEYDPMKGTAAIATFTGNSATVAVSDHPVFLVVTPGAALAGPVAISGTTSGQTTKDNVAVRPFAATVITDPKAGAQDSLTITLKNSAGNATDANGTLSGPGLTKIAAGIYSVGAGTPKGITSELQGLSFTPVEHEVAAGGLVTTTLTVAVSQAGAAASSTSAVTALTVVASNYVTGKIGGGDHLKGTAGADVITAFGTRNVIVANGGNDTINAGAGGAYVYVGSGSTALTLGGAANNVTGGDGNNTVVDAVGGTNRIRLGDGNNTVQLAGYGNWIQLGSGTNVVSTTRGMAFITTGAGNDTIQVWGTSNHINAGAGTNTISGGLGNNTYVAPIAGSGLDIITGFSEQNGDRLDLRGALAATTWNHQLASLSHYLKVSNSGVDTTLAIAQTGAGAGTAILQLAGSGGNLGLADLLSHHSLGLN